MVSYNTLLLAKKGFLIRHGLHRDSFGMTTVLLEEVKPAGEAG